MQSASWERSMLGRIGQFAWLVAAIAAVSPQLAWGTAPLVRLDQPGGKLQPLVSTLAAPHEADGDEWRSSAREVELPQGDPLTAPLALSAAERRLFVDAEDGRLDEHSLVEAALIAGGISDGREFARYQARFEALCEELRRRTSAQATVVQRIESIHRLLHEQVLRSYDADATGLATAFDTGVYNCASGTLLFIALGEEAKLNAQAVELPGHVRAVIYDGDAQWEIEITSRLWSEAIRRLELSAVNSVGGDSYRRPESPRHSAKGFASYNSELAQRRDVPSVGLIATIYYNQGIDAFHGQRFAEAVAANRRALLLDPANREARGNLLAAINNWALALCNADKLDAAESLLAAGRKYDAGHQAFAHNAAYVRRLRMEQRSTADTLN